LGVGDVATLRLPWLSRFSNHTLRRHLQDNPDLSLWVPATGEYVIAEQWRHRDDIANVVEVTSRKARPTLVRALVDRAASLGGKLVLLSDETWRDDPKLYSELGFGRVETIVFFEKHLRRSSLRDLPPPDTLPTLKYKLLTLNDLDLLERMDHDSFPWLWWNSQTELEYYMQIPGVFVYAAERDEEAVGYTSYTVYSGWAHLDRLAVVSGHQGRKYGAAQLSHVLQLMVEQGAASVALSTQETNTVSHRLYKGFGFQQTSQKMSFYGIDIRET
jgi:ribosomal protein S18 acetylase RimI-like enzyme